MPDSIEFRQIQVAAEDAEKTKTLADSIYNAIKGGASFAEIARSTVRPVSLPGFLLLTTKAHRLTVTT